MSVIEKIISLTVDKSKGNKLTKSLKKAVIVECSPSIIKNWKRVLKNTVSYYRRSSCQPPRHKGRGLRLADANCKQKN